MTKENLLEWGLTEEQANKVMEGLNGSFVTKSRFNEVNTELTNAKNTITQLQTDNANQKKAHEAELKALKISNAVDMALTGAKAKNNTAVKALMADFLAKAELADDGTVKGLGDEIKKLVDGQDTAFLFDTKAPDKKFKGAKPGEKSDTPPAGDDPSKMTYDELCQYLEAHPDAKLD